MVADLQAKLKPVATLAYRLAARKKPAPPAVNVTNATDANATDASENATDANATEAAEDATPEEAAEAEAEAELESEMKDEL